MTYCDFCNAPNPDPAWAFPVSDFEMQLRFDPITADTLALGTLGKSLTHRLAGGWFTCRECRRLILRDAREALVIRAADAFAAARRRQGMAEADIQRYRPNLIEALRDLHTMFFEHRTGAPVRVPHAIPIEARPEYVRALDTHLAWLAFDQTPAAEEMWGSMIRRRIHDAMARRVYSETLAHADTFFVSKPIVRMVYNAAKTLPNATFQRTLLPALSGFVVLDDPVQMPPINMNADTDTLTALDKERPDWRRFLPEFGASADGSIFPVYFNAFGWHPTTEGIEFVSFTDSEVGGRKGYWPMAYWGMQDGDSWRDRAREVEADAGPQAYLPSENPHEIAFTMALLLFMDQRILTSRPAHMDRAARRRAIHADKPTEVVRVITLRRYEQREKQTTEESVEVDWSCQWWVGGHWRQQPYPSEGVVRPIWIGPYTKGPPGKPFKDGSRVYVVVR